MTYTGAQIIALSLQKLGVKHVFGIVGIPVVEVAEAFIELGIKFIAFRNEQSAAYAASVYGFVTGRPGVLLVVGGPGVVHALAGVVNSISNRFPLLLLAGSAEANTRGLGSFQQMDQVSLLRSSGAKFAEQIDDHDSIPRLLEQAYRESFYGQPGTTYIDLPANIIKGSPDAEFGDITLTPPADAPKSLGDPDQVAQAAQLLKNAKFPLLIVGKGSAYAHAEENIRTLQAKAGLGFIPTPMGKGVLSDVDTLNLSAARSLVLKEADVVLILGARLNWILHYGQAPRFSKDVKFIQVDNVAETLQGTGLGILGDINHVTKQLIQELGDWRAPSVPLNVIEKRSINEKKVLSIEQKEDSPQLTYQPVYKTIRETLARLTDPKDLVYVFEGANTLDISRQSFPLVYPRTRLDCGTNATMGLGLGYAIAAKVADPSKLIVDIEGDSAIGFSAMEIETAVRSELPIVIIVMNNSGIYHGSEPTEPGLRPPTALSRDTEYHKLAESLGAEGILAKTLPEVANAVEYAVKSNKVVLINIIIALGDTKKLEFGWMK